MFISIHICIYIYIYNKRWPSGKQQQENQMLGPSPPSEP